ncbi:hypothetical protein AYI75_04250 [Shewanella algae]|uniref:hypothetical protein n=1 Tax=Shewanella algae TaxID=38313 RepID=UPI0011A05D77|nr:hypothetical protein [Shewanella algae]TWO86308.1 hypothetical protein AYI75_04250 [Shewanella algae]
MSDKGANSKYLLSVHALTFIVSILTTVILPKALNNVDYIEAMKLMAVVNVIIPICSFGLPTYLMRYYSCNKSNLISNIFLLGFTGLILSFILLTIFSSVSELSIKVVILVLFIAFISSLFSISGSLGRITQSLSLYFTSTFTPKLLLLCSIMICLYYIRKPIDYSLYLELWLLVSIVTLFFVAGKVRALNKISSLDKKNDNKNNLTYKTSLFFCVPLVFSNLMAMFLPLVERYLLQGLIAPEQMVLYLFNLDFFSKVSGVMLLTLKVVVFPKIILLPENRKVEAFKKYLKLCVLFAIGLILISPLLTYFFHNVILKPLGHSDLFDKYVSIVMIVYTLILSINYMVLIGLVIINKNKYLIITTTLTLVLHVAGIYILSPKYGALGASLSLLISSIVSVIVLFLITYKGIDGFQKNNHKIYKA